MAEALSDPNYVFETQQQDRIDGYDIPELYQALYESVRIEGGKFGINRSWNHGDVMYMIARAYLLTRKE